MPTDTFPYADTLTDYRKLGRHQWGQAFKPLLEERGVKRGQGSSRKKQQQSAESETVSDSHTIAGVAAELGVEERTARNRMKAAGQFEALAKERGVERGQASSAAKRHDPQSDTVSDLAAELGRETRRPKSIKRKQFPL